MRLKESREAYVSLTEKASDVSRQLAFASIGIIWIFKDSGTSALRIPKDLIWPTLATVSALLFDFLHYFISVAIWGTYHRRQVRQLKLSEDEDFYPPRIINLPGELLFWCKLLAVGLAYIGLGIYSKRLM